MTSGVVRIAESMSLSFTISANQCTLLMRDDAGWCCMALVASHRRTDTASGLLAGHHCRCVEIPQLGMIRSLNVHVSAAIAMYQYTHQMLSR
jgi:hypothetical protein